MLGEIAVLNVDVLVWDVKHQGCAGRWPQLKTHKFKSILFQAGENRFICPINCMAVAFASECFFRRAYDPEDMNYLYPALVDKSAPSSVITGWLRKLATK